jgi:lipopolysaccharide export system permease protein
VLALNEIYVPRCQELGQRILSRHVSGSETGSKGRWFRNLAFHNEQFRRLWSIGLYDRENGIMWNVNLDWQLENGMRRRVAARQGVFTNGAWTFYGVRQLFFTPLPEPAWETSDTNQIELIELSETPSQINSEIRFASLTGARAAKRARLSLREIREYQQLHPELPPAARFKLKTQYHGRLAEPWTCLVVVFMAIPFGAPSGRRNVFAGVAASIFIAFGYFFAQWFALALGTGGYVVPWMAAWMPNAVFTLTGLLLTLRVR